MFHHMDGVMPTLAKKNTQCQEDLYITVELAGQKLSKYYSEVTPTMGLLLNSAHIPDLFRGLRLWTRWDKQMDIEPEDKLS